MNSVPLNLTPIRWLLPMASAHGMQSVETSGRAATGHRKKLTSGSRPSWACWHFRAPSSTAFTVIRFDGHFHG